MNAFAHAFDYPALAPGWSGPGPLGEELAPATDALSGAATQRVAQLEADLALLRTASTRQIEQARRSAREQALRDAHAEHQRELQKEHERIRRALADFAEQRDSYFRQVEHEVVRLALAIARKVLHREAQMDPLLLSGAVHVVLARLTQTAGVTVRVPPAEAMAWQESLRLHSEGKPCHAVQGDIGLQPGDCILETHVGTVELGVAAQLEEIERGFFDLLDSRPQARATTLA